MLHIENRLWNILIDAPRPSIFKTFLYIALNQPDDGIHGFVIDKIQLAINLNLSQPTLFRDLKWLKDNLLIQELKLLESADFMVNPYLVMNNSDAMPELPNGAVVNASMLSVNSVCAKKEDLGSFVKTKSNKKCPELIRGFFYF